MMTIPFSGRYVRMLEALLATIIRPCLGQGSNKSSPLPKDDANELFGTLRAEEILAINTAFREQLRVRQQILSSVVPNIPLRFRPWTKSNDVLRFAFSILSLTLIFDALVRRKRNSKRSFRWRDSIFLCVQRTSSHDVDVAQNAPMMGDMKIV